MEKQTKAKKYARIKLTLNISETILSVSLLIIFVFGGYSVELRNFVIDVAGNPYLQLLLFAGLLGLAFSLIDIPLSFISGFWLEHRYELSNQTFGAWVWEEIKTFLVGLILLTPLLLLFYYFLRNYPESWWFWTGTLLFIFTVLIGRIAPQVIFPLFYKFEPIDDDNLLSRMRRLADNGGFSLKGVYRFNMSKNTKKANAAFTGLGKSKRIIIGDTLLDELNASEIEAVFAHEVGHYVKKHIWQMTLIGTVTSYLSLYVASIIYDFAVVKLGFQGPADLAAIALLSIILSAITLIITPLNNMLSRFNEWQADDYALNHIENPEAFAGALRKLSETNLSDKTPHPLVEFLFHGHPALDKRIRNAAAFMGKENSDAGRMPEKSNVSV